MNQFNSVFFNLFRFFRALSLLARALRFSLVTCLLICLLFLFNLSALAANLADPVVYPRLTTLGTISITNAVPTPAGFSNNLYATFSYMHDMSVFTTIGGGNNLQPNVLVTNYFDLAQDGTNFTTTQPITVVAQTGAGTNSVWCSVISKSLLEGCKAIRWNRTASAALGSGTNTTVTVSLGITP